jgi:hypothetical protein
MIVRAKADRYDPLQPAQWGTAAWREAAQLFGPVVCQGTHRQQSPRQRIDMTSVKDGLEMQVATCRPSGGTHLGDELSNIDPVARAHGNGFEVVVGGDQPAAVVDLHPVAPAPRVPAGGPDHARVSGVDLCSAWRGIVLAEVEVVGGSGQGAYPETEG